MMVAKKKTPWVVHPKNKEITVDDAKQAATTLAVFLDTRTKAMRGRINWEVDQVLCSLGTKYVKEWLAMKESK